MNTSPALSHQIDRLLSSSCWRCLHVGLSCRATVTRPRQLLAKLQAESKRVHLCVPWEARPKPTPPSHGVPQQRRRPAEARLRLNTAGMVLQQQARAG
mmetsp:Transcript_71920/g.227286  ORF Transcript_71920/g.227286 Transcript_71920/m.227286 type:complete len:98 (-) Transcript_71920:5-298(-)